MNDVNKLLNNYEVNLEKLIEYGFIKDNNIYKFNDILIKNKFSIEIFYNNNKFDYKIWDLNTKEEYILPKIESISGEFVSNIRILINEKFTSIITKCFNENIFKFKQSKEIISYIKEKYKINPEFLWKDENAVFRHSNNKKWFGIMMKITKDKLGIKDNSLVEIIDLKIKPEKLMAIVDNKKYFLGYHMNKKHWLTIILDYSIPTKEIYKFIDESYNK